MDVPVPPPASGSLNASASSMTAWSSSMRSRYPLLARSSSTAPASPRPSDVDLEWLGALATGSQPCDEYQVECVDLTSWAGEQREVRKPLGVVEAELTFLDATAGSPSRRNTLDSAEPACGELGTGLAEGVGAASSPASTIATFRWRATWPSSAAASAACNSSSMARSIRWAVPLEQHHGQFVTGVRPKAVPLLVLLAGVRSRSAVRRLRTVPSSRRGFRVTGRRIRC